MTRSIPGARELYSDNLVSRLAPGFWSCTTWLLAQSHAGSYWDTLAGEEAGTVANLGYFILPQVLMWQKMFERVNDWVIVQGYDKHTITHMTFNQPICTYIVWLYNNKPEWVAHQTVKTLQATKSLTCSRGLLDRQLQTVSEEAYGFMDVSMCVSSVLYM